MHPNLTRSEPAPGIAVVAINRPEVLNAFDDDTMRGFIELIEELRTERELRAVVIDSGERAFSTGSDLEEALAADAESHLEHWRLGHVLFDAIEDLEVPVIAAIKNYALAGGCELALACDLRVAGANAVLGLPEIGLGVIPSCGGTQRLPKLIGPSRAFDILATGRRVGAEEALRIGMIDRIAPPGEELETALDLARQLLRAPAGAVAAAKSLVAAAGRVERGVGAELESLWNSHLVAQPDFAERVDAFLKKRDR